MTFDAPFSSGVFLKSDFYMRIALNRFCTQWEGTNILCTGASPQDFELTRNSDYLCLDSAGPTCIWCPSSIMEREKSECETENGVISDGKSLGVLASLLHKRFWSLKALTCLNQCTLKLKCQKQTKCCQLFHTGIRLLASLAWTFIPEMAWEVLKASPHAQVELCKSFLYMYQLRRGITQAGFQNTLIWITGVPLYPTQSEKNLWTIRIPGIPSPTETTLLSLTC